MASCGIHIANTLQAIADGTIPGAFDADRTEFAFPTLAYVGSRGATHLWTIRVRLLRDGYEGYVAIDDAMLDQPAAELGGYRAEITVESQQKDGKVRDIVPTYVTEGKNLGKKNATNALTQAIRNALGLYNKQRKRADIVPADGAAVDGEPEPEDEVAAVFPAGFDPMPPPMLVKKIGESRESTLTPAEFAKGITAQRKLNGVHFVVFPKWGADGAPEVVCYSRTGTPFPGQAHIVEEMGRIFRALPAMRAGEYGLSRDLSQDALRGYGIGTNPERLTPYFAGELFLSGKTLNWISGQARRGDDEGVLEFHIFDVFFPAAKAAGHDMESRYRQAYIDAVFAGRHDAPHIKRVENFPVDTLDALNALAKRFVAEGYEGAIARKDRAGYRYSYSNYHSANLVKIKPTFDDEYPVVGYTQGTRGKDVGAVIWECEVPNPVDPKDNRFTVVPKDMTYEDRYALFRCLGDMVEDTDGEVMTRFERDLKGRPLTVAYAEISAKTGKPLQPKALAFRTYEEGPERDPVRRLLQECRARAANADDDG